MAFGRPENRKIRARSRDALPDDSRFGVPVRPLRRSGRSARHAPPTSRAGDFHPSLRDGKPQAAEMQEPRPVHAAPSEGRRTLLLGLTAPPVPFLEISADYVGKEKTLQTKSNS